MGRKNIENTRSTRSAFNRCIEPGLIKNPVWNLGLHYNCVCEIRDVMIGRKSRAA